MWLKNINTSLFSLLDSRGFFPHTNNVCVGEYGVIFDQISIIIILKTNESTVINE